MKDKSLTMLALPPDTARLEPEAPAFQPVRLLEVELSQPLPSISAYDARTERCYQRAQVLVRLHTRPLGLVDLHLDEDGLSAAAYADQIWQDLRQAINDHLRQDGLPEMTGLTVAGLPYSEEPTCLRKRNQFLAEPPFVTVVVPTRDRTEQLATCLPSLVALEYPRYEIIVVDNAPQTSATADLIGQHYSHLPHVRYVREDRPGRPWARNCGMRHAQGEIVAYTDDDAVADPHWLAELARGFQTTDNVACVTGLALPAELETQAQVWFEHFGGFSKGFSERIFDLTEHRPANWLYPYSAGIFGAGVNMAFKTSALRALGGFDPAFGNGQDIEAFFRVIIRGYRLVYEPGALIYHSHRKDYSALKKQLYRYGVALTAFVTKCIIDDPKRVFDIGRKLPYGLFYALSSKSSKNYKKGSSYPPELTRIELKGMLYGPLAYFRSRWHVRQTIRQSGPLAVHAK